MNYTAGDRVEMLIKRSTLLGYVVLIDDTTEALLFHSDVHQALSPGDQCSGFVKRLREDGKIDVALKPQGFKNTIDLDCDRIINALKETKTLSLHDKSSPEEIKAALQMSKKAFKKAIGFLYKRKVISIEDKGIRLN